jgi:plastocyanin
MLRAVPVLLVALILAACGGTASSPSSAPASAEASAHASAHAGATVSVTGVDYAFEDVPATVEAGSELTFHNGGTEPHEMVVIRINDGVTQTIDDLLELPEDEALELATVVGAAMALPGEDAEDAVTVTEPGNYAMVCFIPVGSTAEDLQSSEPPAGPPHFTEGMVTSFTVE